MDLFQKQSDKLAELGTQFIETCKATKDFSMRFDDDPNVIEY